MIISGYTVIDSTIKTFSEGITKLRNYEWLSPTPILVKVVAYGKEIV